MIENGFCLEARLFYRSGEALFDGGDRRVQVDETREEA
jgi:hypothetical protein